MRLASADKAFRLHDAELDAMAFPPIDVMHVFTAKVPPVLFFCCSCS